MFALVSVEHCEPLQVRGRIGFVAIVLLSMMGIARNAPTGFSLTDLLAHSRRALNRSVFSLILLQRCPDGPSVDDGVACFLPRRQEAAAWVCGTLTDNAPVLAILASLGSFCRQIPHMKFLSVPGTQSQLF
jgi:hypothetical protein